MITYAVKHGDSWHVLDVGPGTMIAFEDAFGQSMPDGTDGGHMWRHIAWIAHQELAPDEPFELWVRGLSDLTGDDDRIAAIRSELRIDAGLPPLEPEPDPEAEDPTPLQAVAGEHG
jgi:hypothetical protein